MSQLALIVGNTARVIDAQQTEWTLYVRTKEPQFEQLIRRVDVKLHESFAPPTVALTASPFTVTRVGWGTFTVKLQVEVKSFSGKIVRGAFNYKLQFKK
jgi:transcription initiation factor IIF auxiliary subunit